MLRFAALVASFAVIAAPLRAQDPLAMALELQSLELELNEINGLIEVHYRLHASIDESEPAVRPLRQTVRETRAQIDKRERELRFVCGAATQQSELVECFKLHVRLDAERSAYAAAVRKLEKFDTEIDARRKRQDASADPLFVRQRELADRRQQLRVALAGIVRRVCIAQCTRTEPFAALGNVFGCMDACWRGEPVGMALEQLNSSLFGGEPSQAERDERSKADGSVR